MQPPTTAETLKIQQLIEHIQVVVVCQKRRLAAIDGGTQTGLRIRVHYNGN